MRIKRNIKIIITIIIVSDLIWTCKLNLNIWLVRICNLSFGEIYVAGTARYLLSKLVKSTKLIQKLGQFGDIEIYCPKTGKYSVEESVIHKSIFDS